MPNGTYQVRARMRLPDRTRRDETTGAWAPGKRIDVWATVADDNIGKATKALARAARLKLQQYNDLAEQTEVATNATLGDVVRATLDDLKRAGEVGAQSLYLYRKTAENHILDSALAAEMMATVKPVVIQDFLSDLAKRVGVPTAKTARAVISHACRRAQETGVRDDNPATGLHIRRPRKQPSTSKVSHDRALTLDELLDLTSKIIRDRRARTRDLPDLVIAGLNIGGRIGEVLGISWGDITDLDGNGARVSITGSSKRVLGVGVVKGTTKTRSSVRVIPVGAHCARMFLRRIRMYERLHGHAPSPDVPVFTTPGRDNYRDPSNTHTYLRKAFDRAGYEWVVFHSMRRSAVSLVADARSLREAADFAGHARVTTTANNYLGRGKVTAPITDLISTWRLDTRE
jgi:integrase